MKISVILPAAGTGQRFSETSTGAGETANKIELDIAGKPLFMHAVELFLNREDVCQIMLAVHPDRLETFKFRWGDKLGFHDVKLVAGGTIERWETVLKALDGVQEDCTHVAIHDAARPMTPRTLIDRVFEAANHFSAVIPGLPVGNTLKRVAAEQVDPDREDDPLDAILGAAGKTEVISGRVIETVDRADLYEVQTPQVFELSLIRRAYAAVSDGTGANVTDDAQLVEAIGESVDVVEGDPMNFKITRAADAGVAELLLQAKKQEEAAALGRERLFAGDDDE